MTTDMCKYKLVRVTDRKSVDYTRLQNSSSWKGILSSEDYVLREYVLGKSEMTQNMYVFMLQDTTNPQEKLCSIELLVRDAIKYYKDGDIVKQKLVKCGCVGGVFTYPHQRGKGLAKIMLDQLMQLAINEYVGEDGFVFLYSEVGEYYSRCGFKSFAVDVLEMPVNLSNGSKYFHNEKVSQVQVPEGLLETVGYHQFGPLMKQYKSQDEQDIISKVQQDSKTRVSLDISARSIDWFHLRTKFISTKLFESQSVTDEEFNDACYGDLIEKLKHIGPQVYGFKLTNSKGLVGHIAWTYDWKSPTKGYATVLEIFINKSVQDPISMKLKLIEYVQDYLKSLQSTCEYEKLVVWTVELPGVDCNSLGTVKDNPSRSAIRMNSDQEQQQLLDGELIWENNNKLPWF